MRLTRRGLLVSAGATGLAAAGPRAARAEGTPATASRRIEARSLPAAAGEPARFGFAGGGPAAPVLRLPKEAPLDLALTNGLDSPFVLQWHGVRAPGTIDGAFAAPLAPKDTARIAFTPPDAGLFWFHPAPAPGRPDLAGLGLFGVLIVEEPAPPPVDADTLLVLTDDPAEPGGPPRVNGAPPAPPASLPPGGRLRLRVLNASTTQARILGLEGARPMVAAIDGQPSDLFEPLRDSVPVGPGARFEFLVDLPTDKAGAVRLVQRGGGARPGTPALFEARTDAPARANPLPAMTALPPNQLLPPAIPLETSARADLRIEAVDRPGAGPAWRLNGRAGFDLPPRPLLGVKRGRPVTLGLDNRSAALVALRLQGHVMRLLHPKDDGWEPYWRDSVLLLPGSVTHVAFLADNPGRWLLESAFFEQAAGGLRHWFEVLG